MLNQPRRRDAARGDGYKDSPVEGHEYPSGVWLLCEGSADPDVSSSIAHENRCSIIFN